MWRVLSTVEDVAATAARWNALADRDPGCTVYQRAEWTVAWFRHLADGQRCRIFCLEEGGDLVAVFPMWERRLGGITVLEFIGARGTDYMAPILAPGRRAEFYASFFRAVEHEAVDITSFEDIESTHSLVAYCGRVRPAAAMRIETTCACYRLLLPPTWDAYLKTLSPRRHTDIAYDRRHMGRVCGDVRFVRASPATAFPAHARLHQLRRNAVGDTGAYDRAETVAFQQDVANAWEAAGILRLSFLACGDHPVATILAVGWRNHVYAVTIGFDPAARDLSPGSVLLGLCLEDAIAQGERTYDLSRGAEPYKSWWGGVAQENVHVVLGRDAATIEAYDLARREHFAGHHYAPSSR